MSDSPSSGASSLQREDRLDSWKEIAAYLNRDVTTVQRWEKREGMPVHRHQHDRLGSVYASRAELDAWTQSRARREAAEDPNPAQAVATQRSSRRRLGRGLGLASAIGVLIGVLLWLESREFFWRDPVAGATFERVTDFDATTEGAAISADGRLIAFLSDRDGRMDVWLTQVGSVQFHNLTHGALPELANPDIRPLAFTPDDSLVLFWVRKGGEISIWAAPTLGGEPRPYLEGAAEAAWSHDGSRIAYHTQAPGDPLYVSTGLPDLTHAPSPPIFAGPAGLHSHFPIWSPDDTYIYFAHGSIPDKLDIWRVKTSGGRPERITSQNGSLGYPVLLDRRTLLYLARDSDGSGPWLYGMDVGHRVPHKLALGLDRYTSLSASADGRRLALTLATPKRTLWRSRISDSGIDDPVVISVETNGGFSPRLGPGYLVYAAAEGPRETIWKLHGGASTRIWSAENAQVIGAPAVSRDGKQIVFAVRRQQRSFLYIVEADGSGARLVTDSLDLQGTPTWSTDGKSILTAANDRGTPHLFRVPVDGSAPTAFLRDYSTDPSTAPDGSTILYSGPDVGTTFTVKPFASTPASPRFLPLTLSRGSHHLVFVADGKKLFFLRGDLQHKDLWARDSNDGTERQLTHFAPEFRVRDFDLSPDGREVVFEREQQRSDVVLLERPQ